MNGSKLSAVLQFTKSGHLEAILLNAGSEGDQTTIECAVDRLLKTRHVGLIQRLLGKRMNIISDHIRILRNHCIDKLENFILRLFLHRRERIICPEFDRRLSREIDCLLALIER